jgi:hypothetical protein
MRSSRSAQEVRLTEALVRDLRLTEVEVDEFWSFVRKKGRPPRTRASDGAA